ncbi:MAG: hypothetical protein NZ602_07890 [Thermoguttaceae bacterium]|nr:hypothetical protein [Thermoguttaceae bacterium]MDW8038443.1 hypothetical protein [Thermoguttaceae bacterium]
MKTERRHELEENLLARWLVSVFRKIQPYQNVILAGIILVLVVIVVYEWLSRRTAGKAEAAWEEIFTSLDVGREDPSVLEKVAQNHGETEAGQWAALLAAEGYLAKACDSLFTNKTEARDYLNRSRQLFERLLNQTRNEVIRERATFGLARADEAAGDLDKACESWSSSSARQAGQKADRGYRGVLNLWPDGAYSEAAKQRLEDLQRYRTKKFYDDFARWEPPPAVPHPPETASKPKTSPELPVPEGPIYTPGQLLKSKPEPDSPETKK